MPVGSVCIPMFALLAPSMAFLIASFAAKSVLPERFAPMISSSPTGREKPRRWRVSAQNSSHLPPAAFSSAGVGS